jgi:hypothetical protein
LAVIVAGFPYRSEPAQLNRYILPYIYNCSITVVHRESC